MSVRYAAPAILVALFTLSSETGATISSHLNNPTSCENPVAPFDAATQSNIVARIRTAYNYFLNSPDPSVVGTFGQRMAMYDSVATVELSTLRDQRLAAYRATVCTYEGGRRTSGRNARSRTTLTVVTGHYLLPETLERTTSGDWKGGPFYGGPADSPNSLTWVTGGYRPARTFVRIKAKYAPSFINVTVRQELERVRKELADANVPTGNVMP